MTDPAGSWRQDIASNRVRRAVHSGASRPLEMSFLCCHHCRLRFTAEAATYLLACPDCERPTSRVEEPRHLLGFRLFDPLDLTDMVTDGGELSPAPPWPRGRRRF
jgi:hypothetical protein